MKFFKKFNQNSANSGDYWILQELDDHRILMEFRKDFDQNYLKELDDHRISILDFKNFDQNSRGQP